jgi:hypothetical protein
MLQVTKALLFLTFEDNQPQIFKKALSRFNVIARLCEAISPNLKPQFKDIASQSLAMTIVSF